MSSRRSTIMLGGVADRELGVAQRLSDVVYRTLLTDAGPASTSTTDVVIASAD